MELFLQREPTERMSTFGDITDMNGAKICDTLEDDIREPIGWREGCTTFDELAAVVRQWKVPKQTAIPSGRFRLTLEPSKRFGPDTITINQVPGFDGVRMHGGTTIEDTDGCVMVGDKENRADMTIHGAKFDHVLDQLKVLVRAPIARGEQVWLTIKNPDVE